MNEHQARDHVEAMMDAVNQAIRQVLAQQINTLEGRTVSDDDIQRYCKIDPITAGDGNRMVQYSWRNRPVLQMLDPAYPDDKTVRLRFIQTLDQNSLRIVELSYDKEKSA